MTINETPIMKLTSMIACISAGQGTLQVCFKSSNSDSGKEGQIPFVKTFRMKW